MLEVVGQGYTKKPMFISQMNDAATVQRTCQKVWISFYHSGAFENFSQEMVNPYEMF
tara:strand:- start:79002 stop:79172 length:171 start_codon:yes stop_codon:yes gene_type:complete